MITPSNYSILLVEDNPDDILLIQRAFRRANLSNPLQWVTDGDAAVAYLSGDGDYTDRDSHPLPMLMLLDLKLPRRSGLEVLQWLRQQPRIKRLPVVVLTSSRQSADIDRAYELGVNSYLLKPPSFNDLQEMVQVLNLYWFKLNQYPIV